MRDRISDAIGLVAFVLLLFFIGLMFTRAFVGCDTTYAEGFDDEDIANEIENIKPDTTVRLHYR